MKRVRIAIVSAARATLALLCVAATAVSAFAQTRDPDKPADAPKTADEIALELANPNTSLGTMSLNNDLKWYGGDLPGAGDHQSFTMQFQPALPYPLGKGTNLFVRPAIPFILTQPIPAEGGFESDSSAIGDIGFDVAVGKSFRGGWLAVAGMIGSLPTASNDALSLNTTLLGPELLVAWLSKKLVVGVLVNQAWNVTHRDDEAFDTSLTGGQYFITVPLSKGWQLTSSPLFSYNRNASAGNRWSFPVGGGIAKTSILGKVPVKANVQYWYYVASPDSFGSRHQIRLTISPVIPLPW